MTREDVISMMKYFSASYRNFYEGPNITDVTNVWYDAFKDEDKRVVGIAARNYVKSNEFAPTVAGIMKQVNLIKQTDTDTDVWAKLHKAIGNGLYHATEEFEKLPPECQSFVGSASALKELAQTDTGTINTIVKGQFLKRVEAIKEHQEVQRGLPMEVRQAIEESRIRMLQEGE